MKYGKIVLLLGLGLAVTATASVELGRSRYLTNCSACHGNGQKGAHLGTQDEWKNRFESEGKGLVQIHRDGKAPYFGSETFKKDLPHLRDFLVEYASDSGNAPGCAAECDPVLAATPLIPKH